MKTHAIELRITRASSSEYCEEQYEIVTALGSLTGELRASKHDFETLATVNVTCEGPGHKRSEERKDRATMAAMMTMGRKLLKQMAEEWVRNQAQSKQPKGSKASAPGVVVVKALAPMRPQLLLPAKGETL